MITQRAYPRFALVKVEFDKFHLVISAPGMAELRTPLTSSAVKLSITHTIEREPSKLITAVSGGWPKIISNLKSLLETGWLCRDKVGEAKTSAMKRSPYVTNK